MPGVTAQINGFLAERQMLQYRTFGYGHSFGILSHYYGREAGLELREDIDTVLEPGMVISMEPMLTIPDGQPGAGGYREHDILVITEDGAEDITRLPLRPRFQRGRLTAPDRNATRRRETTGRLSPVRRPMLGTRESVLSGVQCPQTRSAVAFFFP